MGMLLAFAPFITFAAVNAVAGSKIALACGLLVSAIIFGRDVITPARHPKILESGTVILFAALCLYVFLQNATLSVIAVRLCVDAGLFVIILISLLLRRPFTLQYAREQVSPELWNNPEFIRTNYVITAVWALAFAAMVLAEAALLYIPGLPHKLGVLVIVLALVGAFKFTGWYPGHRKNAA